MYIDKDALVEEIEKRINFNEKINAHSRLDECNAILSFINTLDVKKVDLDLDYITEELDRLIRIQKPDGDFGWGTLYNVATHFLELGLKAHQ